MRDAGPAGWLNCFYICALRIYNAESPKPDSRRFNYIVKTKYIDDLGIVYLWVSHIDEVLAKCTLIQKY